MNELSPDNINQNLQNVLVHSIFDEMLQSSDDEIRATSFYATAKRRRVLSDTEDEEDRTRSRPKKKKLKTKLNYVYDSCNRKHIKSKSTGPLSLFLRAHEKDGSNIESHMNELICLDSIKKFSKNPYLVLMTDDGADWSNKGLVTLFYLGRLWKYLNLDGVFLVKNAPKDSKWNEIEHAWAPQNERMVGLTIPNHIIVEAEEGGIASVGEALGDPQLEDLEVELAGAEGDGASREGEPEDENHKIYVQVQMYERCIPDSFILSDPCLVKMAQIEK